MITNPEIREIQIFISLVRTGSFCAAARKLGITQPAVSLQIAKLEQNVGFLLFHRSPEGAEITEQGKALLPLFEEIYQEHQALLHRLSYWSRSMQHLVKVRMDGSQISHGMKSRSHPSAEMETWSVLEPDSNWIEALANYETDIVLAGSFLKTGKIPEIQTKVMRSECGITVAWNPEYHGFSEDPFDFPKAISATVILAAPSMALGFREFLDQWCQSVYARKLPDCIESSNEADALDACELGLGVMVFPGNAGKRIPFASHGLKTARIFQAALPNAFEFGIHWRTGERNPQVLATVERLSRLL